MANSVPYRIKSISEGHRVAGLEKPHHPLISIIQRDQNSNNDQRAKNKSG